jgi:glycine betaine/proline transport system substrate-binding protein
MKKLHIFFAILIIMSLSYISAEGQQDSEIQTIVFGDMSWDSIQVHNRIMGFIIENGLEGFKADYMLGDTVPIINGLERGDVDVVMESWHSNYMEVYEKAIASGMIIDIGPNYPDGPQGWYIPRFLVEGPDAPAPDLKSISDLPKYADLFKDPEDPSKGVVYGGVAGWMLVDISQQKFDEYKLEDTFNFTIAGSSTALAASMAGSYRKNEGWCGYYWEPSAPLGMMDMVRLEGSEYDPAIVDILINNTMEERASEVVDILKKYSTSVDDNNKFLAEMNKNEWDCDQAAIWFLQNKEEIWTEWVDSSIADKVKAALKNL